MAFFKGEMSLQEIRYGLSFKRLMELIEVRSKRLIEEQKSLEKPNG